MAAVLASRKRSAGDFFLLDEPAPAPPHLAKRGRWFTPAPAAFAEAEHNQQAILKLIEAAAVTKGAAASSAASAEAEAAAAALREENAALRARAEALDRDNGVLKRGLEALERDNRVLKHGVAALHRREEEATREVAELRKKVAELEATNYALAARMIGTDSCRFQAFGGPDVF